MGDRRGPWGAVGAVGGRGGPWGAVGGRGGPWGPLLESPGNSTYPEQYFNIIISKREKLVLAPKEVYSVSLNKSVSFIIVFQNFCIPSHLE